MIHEGLTLTALAFVLGIACLFFLLLAFETAADASQPRLRHFGLFTWLVSGNWPAKVGAGLMIIGVGALIRYFLLKINISPEIKIGSGIAASALLATASFLLRENAGKRALHLALAGAALGVAYLTAYSAYGFFGYVSSTTALALLVLVVAASGVFAIQSRALSVAVLAMLGAFVSPAFTVGNPGPVVIYGYYLGASLFTFVLVYVRGWRALIHLSFLFTLAGSVFFAWTREFYQPQYFNAMQPLLLAVVAVHLAMPLAERRAVRHAWLRHFDVGYAIALPAVAAVLMLTISPDYSINGALGWLMLAGLWLATAGIVHWMRLDGALQHALVAFLLALGAAALYVEDVPWPLLGLVASTVLLIMAPRLGFSQKAGQGLTGVLLILAVLHIQDALLHPMTGQVFLNQGFFLRLIGIAALIMAGAVGRRRNLPLGSVLSIVGWVWAALVLVIEVGRLKLEILPQLAHGAVIVAVFVIALLPIHKRLSVAWLGMLAALSVATAWWAAFDAPVPATGVFVFLAPLSLLFMTVRTGQACAVDDPVPPIFALAVPLVLAPWAYELGSEMAWDAPFFAMTLTVLAVMAMAYLGRRYEWRAPVWYSLTGVYFWAIAAVMALLLLVYIKRGVWPALFDLSSVAALAMLVSVSSAGRRNITGGVAILIAAFVLQAMLLRWFGPPGILSVADLARMALPAVVSLMWATLGGAFCWWSSRIASRSLWGIGAILLVLSAVKLVLFDFGSLGQLANIMALLLAGGVFLAVAWLAPIPPRRKQEEPVTVVPSNSGAGQPAVAPAQDISVNAAQPPPATAAGHRMRAPKDRITPAPQDTHSRRLVIPVAALALAALALTWKGVAKDEHAAVETASKSAPDEALAISAPARVPESQQLPSAVEPVAEAPVQESQPPRVVDACTQFLDRLPSDYVLLGGGAYEGRPLGFQIDDHSGHEATGFDVVASVAGRPVVLVLGAYEPSVWLIRHDPLTRIAGVFVTGYHRQSVAGLSADTPVLNSTHDDNGGCGYSYLTSDNIEKMDAHVRKIFGRQAEFYHLASNGKLLLGAGSMPAYLVQDAPGSAEDFRDTSAPLAGEAGLQDLLSKGVLRPALKSDLVAWRNAQRRSQGLPPMNVVGAQSEGSARPPFRTYVVQKEMTFPAGLYGAHAATFIVLSGVPVPRGNSGHSTVYDWNTLGCSGVLCQ